MNTRGLMQLVVLNIGYELGVLSPELFAMMVIMALVTTFITVPAIDLIERVFPDKARGALLIPKADTPEKFKILLSFANPESGRTMLHIINGMVKKSTASSAITTLHLSPINEMHLYDEEEFEEESFHSMTIEAENLHLPIKRIFRPAQDFSSEIIETANKGNYDLLLIGMGRSVFKGSLLGKILGVSTKIISPEILFNTFRGRDTLMDETVMDDKVRRITRHTHIPVGILIDKGLLKTEKIIIPISSPADNFLLTYARRFISNDESHISILENGMGQNKDLPDHLKMLDREFPGFIILQSYNEIDITGLKEYDLILMNLKSWEKAGTVISALLNSPVSVLIIKQ
jgi:hypothetical protein